MYAWFESMKYTTWYSQRLVLLSDRTKDLVFPKRKTTTLSLILSFCNISFTSYLEISKFPMVGFYSTRGSPPVMVDLQVKVVDSLSPCFRGDFPESVTADRYVTSEWEDPWKHLKNGKPWAPHHPWTCESSPQSPQTETYSTVNTARARCEDVTSECSRPQNVIQMIHFTCMHGLRVWSILLDTLKG